MYSPAHAAVGVLLAEHLPNAPVAFVVAMASHYVLDAIPHGDAHFGVWLTSHDPLRRIVFVETIDLGLAAFVVIALLFQHPAAAIPKLLAGAIGAITPDLLWGGHFLTEKIGWRIPLVSTFLRHHDAWHTRFHAKANYDLSLAAGMALQAAVILLVFITRL